MNIALLTVSFNNSGPARILTEIALNVDQSKYNVIFIICERYSINNLHDMLVKRGINIIYLNMDGYHDIKRLLKLIIILKKKKIDILHTRLHRADVYGRIAGKFAGIKYIINNSVSSNKKHFSDYHKGLKGLFLQFIDMFTVPFTDIFIANSYGVGTELLKKWPYSTRKIVIIPNGINTAPYLGRDETRVLVREKLCMKKNDLLVGSVGRLVNQKDYSLFVKSALKVLNTYKHVKFLIVGSGKEERYIKTLIHNLSLENHLILLGHQENVLDFLNAMDLFVFTSKYEGMPNAVMEAMASRLPVIAFDIPGVNELVLNGITGILIKERNEQILANKIVELLENEKLRIQMGLNGYQRIKEHYSMEKMVNNFEKIYSKVYEEL